MKKILIAIPCFSYCHWQTMKSVYDLKKPADIELELQFCSGYTVQQARNRLINYAVQTEKDYIFFVDSDIILPNNAIERLLSTDADISTGYYIKKIEGERITELYIGEYPAFRNISEFEMRNIQGDCVVSACGFGVTLIKVDTIKKVLKLQSDSGAKVPMFCRYIEDTDGTLCSEDINACMETAKVGGVIKVALDLKCTHIGEKFFE